jgi:hypothetical protein
VKVYYLRSKDQFVIVLRNFLSWAETQMSKRLHILHSDHGGEYIAASVKEILADKGIEHHLTMLGSPQQNRKAERFNRMILDKGLAMLHTASLSEGFWKYVVGAAVHVYNCTPTHAVNWQTPHEIWNAGHIPDISYFHIFGCMAHMHVPADKCCKLDSKSIAMTFIGYKPGSKGYRLWDKNTRSIHLSRDVTFDESSFPSQGDEPCPAPPPTIPAIVVPVPATKPSERETSPTAQSDSSKDKVDEILHDPDNLQSVTPPARETPLLVTPEQQRPVPISPPPC